MHCLCERGLKSSDQFRIPPDRVSPSRPREVIRFEWSELPSLGILGGESRDGMSVEFGHLVAEDQVVDSFCTGRRQHGITKANEVRHERGSRPLVQIVDR